MPFYDYQCDECNTVTNVRASMSEHSAGLQVACSACESTHTRQVFKAVAVVNGAGAPAGKEFRPPEGPCGSACGCYN